MKQSITQKKLLSLIKIKRKSSKISQKRIADLLCIERSSYSKIENGSHHLKFDDAMAICKFLKINVEVEEILE